MSWLFGFIGLHLTAESDNRFRALYPKPLFEFRSSNTYIAVGGLPETCLCGTFAQQQNRERWAVCGIGMERNGQNCRFLSQTDWQQLLAAESPPLQKLDGHFIAITWNAEEVQCFTDQLGLRTLFLADVDDGVVFSTRLDWIAALREHNEIDFSACGSSWLTFNQIGYDALLKKVRRLGPNGVAILSPVSIKMHSTVWTPSSDHGQEGFAEALQAFLRPAIGGEREISLGLSGGLDSRTLLALLAAQNDAAFCLHVFSSVDDPDVQISQQIARRENFRQIHFDDPIPEAAACMRLLRDYAGQTQFVEPASTILKLRYFPQLHAQQKVIIDGGFGEIARRQFLNRLLLKGTAALKSGDPSLIFPYLNVRRPKIFTSEVWQMMRQGTEAQIAASWRGMPLIPDFGAENFVDLFAIRTRLPNFYGFEQARMDGECASYMPFAQPSVLNGLFKTPVAMRKNARFFRQLIRRQFPSLTRYPLVKSSITYPFRFSTIPAWAWTKFKAKFGQAFHDTTSVAFLHRIAEEVQDLVHSTSVQSYPAYNYSFIRNMVEKFYGGQTELAPQVHWWLAFETWRRTVKS